MIARFFLLWSAALIVIARLHGADLGTNDNSGLRVGTFDIDATPPIGSMMAYDPMTNHWDLGLRARGVVLLGAGEPIVLCAIDWIGIANEGHDAFCKGLAAAAGTTPSHVAV